MGNRALIVIGLPPPKTSFESFDKSTRVKKSVIIY